MANSASAKKMRARMKRIGCVMLHVDQRLRRLSKSLSPLLMVAKPLRSILFCEMLPQNLEEQRARGSFTPMPHRVSCLGWPKKLQVSQLLNRAIKKGCAIASLFSLVNKSLLFVWALFPDGIRWANIVALRSAHFVCWTFFTNHLVAEWTCFAFFNGSTCSAWAATASHES